MSKYRIDTVDRAMQLLLEMAEHDRPVRLRDLTQRLGWNKTTTYRLVKTLQGRGALIEVGEDGYLLGPTLIALGQAAARNLRSPVTARPFLQALHDEIHETVNLGALAGNEAVILERIEDKTIFGLRLNVGSSVPAYCTSMGLILLSDLDDDELRRRFPGPELKSQGPKSVTTLEELLDRVRDVRDAGYAINDEELAAGHRAVAVPLRDHSGSVSAAINISLPSARMTCEELEETLLPKLRETANRISKAVGASDL